MAKEDKRQGTGVLVLILDKDTKPKKQMRWLVDNLNPIEVAEMIAAFQPQAQAQAMEVILQIEREKMKAELKGKAE